MQFQKCISRVFKCKTKNILKKEANSFLCERICRWDWNMWNYYYHFSLLYTTTRYTAEDLSQKMCFPAVSYTFDMSLTCLWHLNSFPFLWWQKTPNLKSVYICSFLLWSGKKKPLRNLEWPIAVIIAVKVKPCFLSNCERCAICSYYLSHIHQKQVGMYPVSLTLTASSHGNM